jgi:hypothetical protein
MLESQAFGREFMAVVRNAASAEPVFDKLRELVVALVGCGLMTASVFDRTAGCSRRVYSENPEAYPVGGFKPIEANRWTKTVLDEKQVFASRSIEEIAEVFFDWQFIRSLGFESNANLPVIVGGQVIGTLNLLEKSGFCTRARLARAEELMPYAIWQGALRLSHRAECGKGKT